ncbi:MAG: FAD:protein FMN transferase, partial [Myxococcota bacterium]
DLWIRAADQGRLPSPQSIDRARRDVGAERIRVIGNRQVELPTPGMSIDLGGIAKGWALDRLAEDLAQRDVGAALLNFGESSVWAIGQPQGEAGWRLALRAPGSGLAGVPTLRNRALSVSSGLEQGSEIEGRRYGHVVNPMSGQALLRLVQVAVVATNATLAEALSTALVVQGPREGLVLVEATPGVEAFWIDAAGQRTASRGWHGATNFEPASGVPGVQSSSSSGSSSRVRKF